MAWKLYARALWSYSKDEWMTGWAVHGCHSIEDIKNKINMWIEIIFQDNLQFTKFYKFVFNYLREDKRILVIEEAILIWDLVIKPKGWMVYDKWINYSREKLKCVSMDAWNSLLEFMEQYPETLENYDFMQSWPAIYDEFVEWYNDNK